MSSKSSDQKMPISDFQSQFSMSKMIRIFLNCVLVDPFECSKKGMDKPKQERVWMDQDVIDSPHCILIYQLFFMKKCYLPLSFKAPI